MKRSLLVGGYLTLLASSCSFDSGSRWFAPEPEPAPEPLCQPGALRCSGALERCVADAAGEVSWEIIEDCAADGMLCSLALERCVECHPDEAFCAGQEVRRCHADGMGSDLVDECDTALGRACRAGACPNLCVVAQQERSNVGCEYWAVDLDNAMIDATNNAAAQQYAVVVSNPQPDVAVTVRILQDDSELGEPHDETLVAEAVIAPLNLRVFKLGPREVDGSPEGEYDTGTHTALTRNAYKVVSDFPVVAYQFNPLENVNVFSNDASLLKPREALTYSGGMSRAYVVVGWPQTIAITDDPNTNFSSAFPSNLRAFLTIVGTVDDTRVLIRPTTDVLGGGPIPATAAGETLELTIHAYEVVNLETPSFNSFGADFTGTLIDADKPIAVFSGNEASDAPSFESLVERRCCADHLEEQLDPVRTAGKRFGLVHSPSRTQAVARAGADLEQAPEPEYFRFVAASDEHTVITTTLAPPHDELHLYGVGDWIEVSTTRDFIAEASAPIHVAQVMASQDAASVPRGLPGGDPSLLIVPPIEQYRKDYVFLTPDKYAFDFIMVVAPLGAVVRLDGQPLDAERCTVSATDGLSSEARGGKPPELVSYVCQLSFPVVDPDTGALSPGQQNDGVHRIEASAPVGVTVYGFDAYVSYAYAAGTELREIAAPR